jgi:uncharacterized membrane protein
VRVLSHLLSPRSTLTRRFPSHALTAIEEAVEASERRHTGEIRVAIEVALDVRDLMRLKTPRQRALELFSQLEVWNTAARNGVLVYILLAEHDVEIVADRGLDGRVTEEEWRRVCEIIEAEFREQRWRDGVVHGVEAIGALLEREYPAGEGVNPDEQRNRPAVL